MPAGGVVAWPRTAGRHPTPAPLLAPHPERDRSLASDAVKFLLGPVVLHIFQQLGGIEIRFEVKGEGETRNGEQFPPEVEATYLAVEALDLHYPFHPERLSGVVVLGFVLQVSPFHVA